jgi:uncharacterized membrane protein
MQFINVSRKQISERAFAYWSVKLLVCQDQNIWDLPDTIHIFETKTSVIDPKQKLASVGSVCKFIVVRCPVRISAETANSVWDLLVFLQFLQANYLIALEECRLPLPSTSFPIRHLLIVLTN